MHLHRVHLRRPFGHHTVIIWMACAYCCLFSGCGRGLYRRTADRDAYHILTEKGAEPTWSLPSRFTVEPDPRSRFHDATCVTDPQLPVPAPRLYGYDVPLLATEAPPPRELSDGGAREEAESIPSPEAESGIELLDPSARVVSLPPPGAEHSVVVAAAAHTPSTATVREALEISTDDQMITSQEMAEELPAPSESEEPYGQDLTTKVQPVPIDAWQSLPASCLMRMLEFREVRDEYARSFGKPVEEGQLDPAQRINLENILEIALINSREYQTRKEILYRTALALSLERFDYDLRFLRRGNGIDVDYTHSRVAGVEVNTLAVPSGLGITKSLYSAGELVARFANDVVLTFNGPTGYSSSVGSELLIDLFQPLIQRDVRFEPLTQSERDVVYAARDFVRFRKQISRDLSVQYYTLLLNYRSIAINTQDYFSNLDGFNRSDAMYQVGRIPRFQVDQFEQNALRSRGNLIDSCNSLEQSLDRLKLRVGLPPELPLNLDLSELDSLTQSDEARVYREQITRARDFLSQQLQEADAVGAIPAAAKLARRMLSLMQIAVVLERAEQGAELPFELLVARLEAEDKRIEARENASVLTPDAQAKFLLLPLQVFLRKKEVIELTLEAIWREQELLELAIRVRPERAADANGIGKEIAQFESEWRQLADDFREFTNGIAEMTPEQMSNELPALTQRADDFLGVADALETRIEQALEVYNVTLYETSAELLHEAVRVAEESSQGAFAESTALTTLEVDMDEAMLTALVQRLDLMNRRGDVADAWRQIKYAGDDLKSILNVRGTQSIRTRSGTNRPFDFTFDDSTTRLSLEFDSPLNRRFERNGFRVALINYQVALRNLIDAEDNIKLDIRDDLRDIQLDQNQYAIAIASAALASERVTSTRLQLQTSQGNITARDFLEAQQDYTQSLNEVARRHISYIINRINFFLDLEQMQVDPVLYWPDLKNEDYPFLPNTDFGSTAPRPYGVLANGPWYSKWLRRMERVPGGDAVNLNPNPSQSPMLGGDDVDGTLPEADMTPMQEPPMQATGGRLHESTVPIPSVPTPNAPIHDVPVSSVPVPLVQGPQ